MTPQTLREAALQIWFSQIGKPYIWGGDDPIVGFDCSGLVQEGIKGVGIIPRTADFNADGLLNIAFKNRPRLQITQLKPGVLLFWKRGAVIGHVEIIWAVIGNRVLTIGASGGGSATTSPAAAAEQNAYVKIMPAVPGWAAAVDPFDD